MKMNATTARMASGTTPPTTPTHLHKYTINNQSSTRRGKIGPTTDDRSNVGFTVDSDWGKRIGRRRPTGTRRNRASPQSERVHLLRFNFRVPYPTSPASRTTTKGDAKRNRLTTDGHGHGIAVSLIRKRRNIIERPLRNRSPRWNVMGIP